MIRQRNGHDVLMRIPTPRGNFSILGQNGAIWLGRRRSTGPQTTAAVLWNSAPSPWKRTTAPGGGACGPRRHALSLLCGGTKEGEISEFTDEEFVARLCAIPTHSARRWCLQFSGAQLADEPHGIHRQDLLPRPTTNPEDSRTTYHLPRRGESTSPQDVCVSGGCTSRVHVPWKSLD